MMTTELEELPTDPVAMARLYATGRALKRADAMHMVKGLLALLDAPTATPVPPVFSSPTPTSSEEPSRTDRLLTTLTEKSPIKVHVTDTKSVFLGPEANRYYTKAEALALAGELARAAIGGGK